jgi:hypothetical protein
VDVLASASVKQNGSELWTSLLAALCLFENMLLEWHGAPKGLSMTGEPLAGRG